MKLSFLRSLALFLMAIMLCVPALAEEPSPTPRLPDDQLYSFFDGALFVGDSITRQLHVYVIEQRREDPSYFAGARFLTAQSYALYTASRKQLMPETVNLAYRGRSMTMYDIIEEIRPPRVFILLGVNDYVGEKIEKAVGWAERIVDVTAQVSPGTHVIFQSLTPVTPAFCRKRDYSTLWDQYNDALRAMCERKGAGYVNIAEALKNEDGYLRPEYSSDGEYHLNPAGLRVWLNCLMDYAQAQYEGGQWTPQPTP